MHLVDLPDWAVARGRGLTHTQALDLERTALVNIDMQRAFVAEDGVFGNPHARDVIGTVNALSRALRALGASIVWTRQTYAAEGPFAEAPWSYDLDDETVRAAAASLTAGAPGHALHPLMQVEPGDHVLDKHRYGAFSCPRGALGSLLSRLGVTTVIITGTLTNICCESTAREAYMAGYRVIVVSDATAAVTDAEHNAALLNLRIAFSDVRTSEVVMALARAGSAAVAAGEG